ncbi:MAG: helix-turn-helix domain-containing protein [Desulfobacteraceae bacterium]|jgi:REP element-mobilizing transposase RayT
MPRPIRIDYPNAWHHVMNQGRNGRRVFLDDADYLLFIDLMVETVEIFNARIAAFCLLPTQYLLLLQTPDASLTRCMRHINGIYTQRYNYGHGSEGPIFKGRYRSILIDANRYLLPLVHYIHQRPLTCELVKELIHYPWSSHKGYLSSAARWNWLCKDIVFAMILTETHQSLGAYKRFMSQTDSTDLLKMVQRPRLPSILGDDGFIDRIKSDGGGKRAEPGIIRAKPQAPSCKCIISQVCRHYGVKQSCIMHVHRGSTNDPRDVAIYLIRILRAESFISIAERFNLNHYSSVGSVIARVKLRLQKDRGFKKQLVQIKNHLTIMQLEN